MARKGGCGCRLAPDRVLMTIGILHLQLATPVEAESDRNVLRTTVNAYACVDGPAARRFGRPCLIEYAKCCTRLGDICRFDIHEQVDENSNRCTNTGGVTFLLVMYQGCDLNFSLKIK